MLASASDKPSVSPSRAATSGNNAVPARDDKPMPSALTFTVLTLERPITFKVNLLSGGICASQPDPPCSGGRSKTPASPRPHATDESRLERSASEPSRGTVLVSLSTTVVESDGVVADQ